MELYFILAFYIIILLYSIILHEISHGVVALWLGDQTARLAGRLTLQPLPHIDPFGSIILPVIMILSTPFAFGWAKPVPYNPNNLIWSKWGPVAVAFAGPLTNFILATIAAIAGGLIPLARGQKADIIYSLSNLIDSDIVGLIAGDLSAIFFTICVMIIFWNVLLGIFNLIPIPPLDGSKLLFALVPIPLHIQQFLNQWGFFIVLGVLFFTPMKGIFGGVLSSVLNIFYTIAL